MSDRNDSFDILASEIDEKAERALAEELSAAQSKLEKKSTNKGSWQVASEIVTRYRPVPWILWRIIHAVYGKPGVTGKPDPITFDLVRPLVVNASKDKTLFSLPTGAVRPQKLEEIVPVIGLDVCAALCVVHGVCRRISNTLSERVWRPILDDALMRAQIGYHVGGHSARFGRGRGILAGFSARSGLAVLIASGDMQKAQRALEGLAAGMDLRNVGITIYGCDPLQVAAMTLSAAGCSIDAALGTASFGIEEEMRQLGPEEFMWASAFSICEHLRMGTTEQIEERHWQTLDYTLDQRADLKERTKILQRKGPSWQWIVDRQV